MAASEKPSEKPSSKSKRYLGLDGLKGLAIIAIILYHVIPLTFPGGFVGVDMFLTISGFVICTSLVRSLRRGKGVKFFNYLVRRLKRIVPALAFMVAITVIIAAFIDRDLLVRTWQQALAGVTCTYNLYTMFSGANYFDSMNPRLFNHIWYVGILMQLYIVAPLLVCLLWMVKNRRIGVYVFSGLAVVSFILMAVWYDPTNITIVYEGPLTHCGGFMLGMALSWYREAYLADKVDPESGTGARLSSPSIVQRVSAFLHDPRFWRIATPISGIGMILFVFFLTSDALAFRGGIVLSSIFSVLIIEYTIREETLLQRFLELQPLKTLGKYSYAIYLWHWPLWLFFSRGMGDVFFLLPFAIAMLFTAIATFVSDKYVENWKPPVASSLYDSFPIVLGIQVTPRRIVFAVLALGAVIALLTAPQQTQLESDIARLEASQTESQSEDGSTELGEIPADLSYPEGSEMIAVGDSVMLFCSDSLEEEFSGILVNAKSARGWDDGLTIIEDYKNQGSLRRWLVVGLTSNSYLETSDLENLRNAVGDNVVIAIVGAYGPASKYPRYPEMNEMIQEYAQEHSDNTLYVDWYTAASQHTDLLYDDGVHPDEQEGGALYADTIASAITNWLDERNQSS